jgi:tetratricopeptide (TPR) repeat protein
VENSGSIGLSPWFARRAVERLAAGNTTEAVRLCVEGMAKYPWYATGAYVLGMCYERLGRRAEAVIEFRRACGLAPDASVVREALGRAERREQEAFEEFAGKQIDTLSRSPGLLGFEEYLAGEGGAAENSAEFLRKQAEAARHEETQSGAGSEAPGLSSSSPRIVTVTLAEIYAAQGEYGEAVKAYRTLLEWRPEDAEGFQRRIRELEALAASATEKPLE